MSRTGLWDSHAHMDSEYYASDRDKLLQSLSHELKGIINPGCDGDSSSFAVKLAEQYDFVYAAVGYHPEELGKLPADYLEQLALWARHPKVVAIGEIGLDYYWKDNEPREVQRRVFLEQAALAEEYGLPLIIHDRDAHGDMLELFQKQITGVEAVFHCFSGSLEMAKELLKRGYYLGFGGTSTYKNAEKVREVLRYAPRDRILFETDSPYLTPVPFRGKRNNPAYVEYTARNAAELLGMDFEELAAVTAANTRRLFKKIM